MANSVTIKLEGFKELDAKLRAFGPKVAANGLRAANFAGAKVMLAAVKDSAPVRTGEMKASIRIFRRRGPPNQAKHAIGVRGLTRKFANTAENRRRRRVGKKYKVDGPGFYARFVEYGTSKMAARPFLRPAFQSSVDAAIEAVRARMQKAVEKAAK